MYYRKKKILFTFLIATFFPVLLSIADITTPYAPWPIYLIGSYLSSISKIAPKMRNKKVNYKLR